MISLSIILIFILGAVALIDVIYKKVPAVFLTAFMIIALAINPQNLVFGIMAYMLMVLVGEFDFERIGKADKKVMFIIGMMIATLQGFFQFAIIFIIFQLVYVFMMRKFIYKEKEEEIPFLFCLYVVYLALYLGAIV